MLHLDIPLVPDKAYLDFVNKHRKHISTCHFGLYSEMTIDARHLFGPVSLDRMIELLKTTFIDDKYLLLNSRFHPAEFYNDPTCVQNQIKILDTLLNAGVITGIVYADSYWLEILSDASPQICAELEAKPSINCMVDSYDKAMAIFDHIEKTRFKPPSTLVLDRSLNRNPEMLEIITRRLKNRFPHIKLELIANEGCLYQCPYKLTHDALIALLRSGKDVDTHTLNSSYGCIAALKREPAALFKSPFIRPEDMDRYEPYVHVIKLCGRTLGPVFLRQVVQAYIDRRFSGNLISLFDANNWLAQIWHIKNQEIPLDFFKKVTTCDRGCTRCQYCQKILEQCGKQLPFTLEHFK